jgi:hypothetical protein
MRSGSVGQVPILTVSSLTFAARSDWETGLSLMPRIVPGYAYFFDNAASKQQI